MCFWKQLAEPTAVWIPKSFFNNRCSFFATGILRKNGVKNENVATAFHNLSKMYSSISHKIILKKLKNLHFEETALTMMENYLTETHRKVTLTSCDSELIQLYQGVPQGTVLGILSFTVYVIGRQQTVSETCFLRQHADDTMTF